MNLTHWLFMLACSLLNYLLRFVRWHYYLRYLTHSIPASQNFLYYLAGFALTLTPAKVGETIRSSYLAQHGVPYTRSLAMFFVDRFADVVVVSLLSLFVLKVSGHSEHINQFIIIMVTIIVSFIPLMRQTFVTRFLYNLHKKITWNFLSKTLLHLSQLLTTARDLLALKPVYTGLLLGLFAWFIQGIAFYFIVTTLGIEITLQQSIGIYAISLLAGAASFIPGGIGTTEAAMTLLLTLLGADTATAIAAALISRLATLWFAVCLGFTAALILSFNSENFSGKNNVK